MPNPYISKITINQHIHALSVSVPHKRAKSDFLSLDSVFAFQSPRAEQSLSIVIESAVVLTLQTLSALSPLPTCRFHQAAMSSGSHRPGCSSVLLHLTSVPHAYTHFIPSTRLTPFGGGVSVRFRWWLWDHRMGRKTDGAGMQRMSASKTGLCRSSLSMGEDRIKIGFLVWAPPSL